MSDQLVNNALEEVKKELLQLEIAVIFKFFILMFQVRLGVNSIQIFSTIFSNI